MPADPPVFRLQRGDAPLLVSMPHIGTHVPDWLLPRLTSSAVQLVDTDWHLDLLYDFLGELGVSCIAATYSRYVVDLNRPPDDASLYPGQNTTGLCPVQGFHGEPLYHPGAEPDTPEIAQRLKDYWRPYHTALAEELARLRAQHDQVMLWDAHSIHSSLPRLFEGELPHLNIGTADHAACAPTLTERVAEIARQSGYAWVVNGRFKGGYITRHYGRPNEGIHALQMEMAQRTYMRENDPQKFDTHYAGPARQLLHDMLQSVLQCLQPAARVR
jgi:N-formylglutamate deformylase